MNKEKGKHKWSLFFLPRSQHKIEMWRNSHHRKRFFCSSCSIMTAWALERSVSYWATPFPVLFSTAWQLIFWLPIHFCLSSDFFFHRLFCSFAVLSACIFGSRWCGFSWQVIVINHVHASNLLCCKTSLRKQSGIPVFLEIFSISASMGSPYILNDHTQLSPYTKWICNFPSYLYRSKGKISINFSISHSSKRLNFL